MNAEDEMNAGDGLGGDPAERETPGVLACQELAEDAGYSDGTDGEESDVDSLIAYKDALEDRYTEAVDVLYAIASGVPVRDEWKSAADFMEWVAGTLDRVPIVRPDHYPPE